MMLIIAASFNNRYATVHAPLISLSAVSPDMNTADQILFIIIIDK